MPTGLRHGMGVLTYSPLAGGWLSGCWRTDTNLPTLSPARQRLVARYDMSLPENQRKLEGADALGQLAEDAGLSLIEMAIAFVVNHPAATSAIIGPRTVEHLESQPRRLKLRQPRTRTSRKPAYLKVRPRTMPARPTFNRRCGLFAATVSRAPRSLADLPRSYPPTDVGPGGTSSTGLLREAVRATGCCVIAGRLLRPGDVVHTTSDASAVDS